MIWLENRLRAAMWLKGAIFLAAALGAANLVLRIRISQAGADFQCFWLAARTWRAGLDPYGPDYGRMGADLFGSWSPVVTWLYPPHFLPFVVPFGLLPFPTALLLWNLTGLIMSGTAAVLLGKLFARTPTGQLALAAAMIAFLGLMTASGSALGVGQISFLILFGVALITWGIGRQAPLVGAVGMAIVMLKPQVGIVICCTIPFFRPGIRMTAWGIFLVVIASLPGLIIGGIGPTIQGFLYNLGHYRSIDYNTPQSMTGLANPIQALTGRDMPAIPMSLVGCLFNLAAVAVLHLRARSSGKPAPQEAAASYLVLSLSAVAGFVMLHIYDLVILSPLMVILPRLGARAVLACLLSILILLRPENLGRLIGVGGPQVAAAGGILLLLGALAYLLRPASVSAPADAMPMPAH